MSIAPTVPFTLKAFRLTPGDGLWRPCRDPVCPAEPELHCLEPPLAMGRSGAEATLQTPQIRAGIGISPFSAAG